MKKRTRKILVWIMLILMIGSVFATLLGYIIAARYKVTTQPINNITSKSGHYVAPVKGNQGTLESQIKEYFEDKELYNKAKSKNYYVVTEKAHGTVEQREYIFTEDISW